MAARSSGGRRILPKHGRFMLAMWGIEMSRPWPIVCLLLLCVSPLPAQTLTAKLTAAVPKSASQCDAAHLAALRTQAEELDRWAAGQAWQRMASGADAVNRVGQVVSMKAEVDRHLKNVLELRSQVAPLVEEK